MDTCRSSFHALLLYDVADEIDLDRVRELLGAEPPSRKPEFKLPAPVYVRFERPPVAEPSETISLSTGETFAGRLRYFDYGVVSLELETRLQADWEGLIQLSNRWMDASEIEQKALQIVRQRVGRLTQAMRKPYADWLDEVYYAIHVRDVHSPNGQLSSAADILAQHGGDIARIVRGELNRLSAAEEKEVLGSSMSYYPTDLLVVGWMAAFIYDTAEGAAANIQLLEYANTQLLEYRRYDEVLTRLLKHAYDSLERRGSMFSRWKLVTEANRLNTLRLDITELSEGTDNAIKLLSDMFYARAYQMASAKIGVNDYRHLVDEKLRTAGELYEFMVNDFRDARSFVLEAMVVIILIIEIVFLFRGK
jgi:hypothetical protein